MNIKRLIAYFFDVLIISIISSLIFTTVFPNQAKKVEEFGEELIETIKTTGSTGLEENTKEVQEISYNYSKANSTNVIINISLQIVYFIFLQFFLNGQTLGKQLFKQRIKPIEGKKLNPGLFVLRETILLALPFKIADIILLFTTHQNTYLKISPFINNATTILYLVIIGSLIFRNDERAIHDLVGKTKVETETKK